MEILTKEEFNNLLNELKKLNAEEQIDKLIELYLNNEISLKEFKILNTYLNLDER